MDSVLTKERIKHCAGVASFIYDYGNKHGFSKMEIEELYVVGLLHDIGYLNNKAGIQHGKAGADLCRDLGLKEQYCELIENHGVFSENASATQKLFWLADMCIDRDGKFEGYEKRYRSICKRFGEHDYRAVEADKIMRVLRKEFPEYAG